MESVEEKVLRHDSIVSLWDRGIVMTSYSTKDGVATRNAPTHMAITNFRQVPSVNWGPRLCTMLCFRSKDTATKVKIDEVMHSIGNPLITRHMNSPTIK